MREDGCDLCVEAVHAAPLQQRLPLHCAHPGGDGGNHQVTAGLQSGRLTLQTAPQVPLLGGGGWLGEVRIRRHAARII